jgi:tetratricopeptide (TPR) repeat protein
MKRALAGFLLLLVVVAGVLASQAAARERTYRRLIAEGEAAVARDQTFVAIEKFSGAIVLRPDAMLGYLKRGGIYRRRGDDDEALRDLRIASELDPAATRPVEQLGDVEYGRERYAHAAEHYERYVRLDDQSARVFYKLGLARYRAGWAAAAVEPLRRAVALDEGLGQAHYLLGVCLRDTQHPDAALAALTSAVRAEPSLLAAREELADLYESLGRRREGIQQLDALAALDSRPGRYVALGLAHARAGQFDPAVLTLGNTVERYPAHAHTYVALGRVWLDAVPQRNDALRKAIEALEVAVAAPERNSEALTLLGRALLLAGEIPRADRLLQQAVATPPIEPEALRYLADAAERQEHYADARAALLKYEALAAPDGDPARRATRAARIGDLSMQLNEPEAAAAAFQRAADAAPPDARLLQRLADAHWRAGNLEAARAAVARGLELQPRHTGLLRLRARLR